MLTLEPDFLSFLRGKIETAQVMLFTGAGFSMDAKDIEGNRLPSADALTHELWSLCYGSDPFDKDTALQDIYEQAATRKRNELIRLLHRRLRVNPDTLPDYYKSIFSLPWKKIYTVNIDDLANVAQRKFDLPMEYIAVSGTTTQPFGAASRRKITQIEVVHLNGTLDDVPDRVTFSREQYAYRQTSRDPTYTQLVSDLVSHPFIFVGTRFDEPVLWQHIQLRGQRGGREYRELRPRSFLVTPNLGRAKQDLLSQYNVEWCKGYTEDLAQLIKAEFEQACETGRTRHFSVGSASISKPELVSELLSQAKHRPASRFLLGEEPDWFDIRAGVPIQRTFDQQLIDYAHSEATASGILALTGTAATGKTTSGMRLAAQLSSEGYSCYWLDAQKDFSLSDLRRWSRQGVNSRTVVLIDDADRFGSDLGTTCRELRGDGVTLVVPILRSSKLDRIFARHGEPVAKEAVVPPLADADIDELINLLDRNSLLGRLKGMSQQLRHRAFREVAGRQLLVAMIEATSGRKFDLKVVDEWEELQSDERRAYALLAIAHSLKFSLRREELLFALGEGADVSKHNSLLNAVDSLARRHVIALNAETNEYRTRHRYLADVLVTELGKRTSLGSLIGDLAYVVSAKVNAQTSKSAREFRLLRALLNHDYLIRLTSLEEARVLYERIEELASWNTHYFLQRGSMEVEAGDLRLADNYLSQARSMDAGSSLVATEYAYMRLKKAAAEPSSSSAAVEADEGVAILVEQISSRGHLDEHPYHVLGAQGLKWSRKGIPLPSEQEKFLRKIVKLVEEGTKKHPSNENLRQLLNDLRVELVKVAGARG